MTITLSLNYANLSYADFVKRTDAFLLNELINQNFKVWVCIGKASVWRKKFFTVYQQLNTSAGIDGLMPFIDRVRMRLILPIVGAGVRLKTARALREGLGQSMENINHLQTKKDLMNSDEPNPHLISYCIFQILVEDQILRLHIGSNINDIGFIISDTPHTLGKAQGITIPLTKYILDALVFENQNKEIRDRISKSYGKLKSAEVFEHEIKSAKKELHSFKLDFNFRNGQARMGLITFTSDKLDYLQRFRKYCGQYGFAVPVQGSKNSKVIRGERRIKIESSHE